LKYIEIGFEHMENILGGEKPTDLLSEINKRGAKKKKSTGKSNFRDLLNSSEMNIKIKKSPSKN